MKSINLLRIGAILCLGYLLSSCAPSASSLKKVIEENPEIIFGAIEKNPEKFLEVVNKAARQAQVAQRKKKDSEEQGRMENEYKNPKVPSLSGDRVVFGKDNAPITIIEYSDFQCPYCSKAYRVVEQVRDKFKDKVKVIYKHLPLDFHDMAMPAAVYYEAIALQNKTKAHKFHDKIFQNQTKLGSGGKSFLDSVAKELDVNMARLKKDLTNPKVKAVIDKDMAEAKKFGFSGTPGFLINGVSLKGAYPLAEFEKVINRHLSKGSAPGKPATKVK